MAEIKYILDGKRPVLCLDPVAWWNWFQIEANRRVALDKVGDAQILTVFVGIDNHLGIPPLPLLFETIVLGGGYDRYQKSCTTWDEAVYLHAKVVEEVRRGMVCSAINV